MRRNRCTFVRSIHHNDWENVSEIEPGMMVCVSCQEKCFVGDAGTCKECYEEANETKEELKRDIEDIKSKVAFLSFGSPSDPAHLHGNSFTPPGFSDVVLVAFEDGSASMPVPAHKAVLVSTHFSTFSGHLLPSSKPTKIPSNYYIYFVIFDIIHTTQIHKFFLFRLCC